ncbi:unnamed protein product, partial [Durusdinium trenchii]
IYDGRYFDPSTRAAINAVWQLAEPANGTVKLGLHKGHMNPASSQGYLEVSSVEAKALAKAKLIDTDSVWQKRQKI